MGAKFKLDLGKDFDFVRQTKKEQTNRPAKKPEPPQRKTDADKTNSDNINIDNMNIHKQDKQKGNNRRKREPQSADALRGILLAKLNGKNETVVKMTEIAGEIGFSVSWMQFAMKYLAERGEFSFSRYAEGKIRGMRVTRI
jgi:hypothetical protein